MNYFSEKFPLIGLGMSSVVLGVIGMMLFFLPILGVPLSAVALCFGIAGAVTALFTPGSNLRWSVAGVAVSCLALGINLAILYAPEGYLPGRKVPQMWQLPPDRPFVPPPARPAGRD
jgi:hypothetical protein